MSSRPNLPLLVLGLGNRLRQDDGLGGRAVEMLAGRRLPASVTVLDGGTPGWGLVERLQGWSQVILVDAARMGGSPGSWKRLSLEDLALDGSPSPGSVDLRDQAFLSLHEAGVVEGLNLARALKLLPEEILLYCVEPECTDNGTGLSPAVEAVLPELVEDIYQELWKRQE